MDTSKLTAPDMQKRTPIRKKQTAFSLVEVTLAIGVVAFAFIGVFGLIPTGLNTFHQAVDASVGSQIAQKVINEAQQTDFDTLTDSANLPQNSGTSAGYSFQGPKVGSPALRYFDEQGNELPASAAGRAIYQVRTRIMPATLPPYTGSSQPATNSDLATVTIQIANNPANQQIAVDKNTNLWSDFRFSITAYSTLVSKNK